MDYRAELLFDHVVKRRDLAQQVHDVLVVCRRPRLTTAILRKANLGLHVLAPMLEDLVAAEFLEEEVAPMGGRRTRSVWRTTATGEAWLLRVEELYGPFVSLEG